jgi:uncharacterized RDD family membrane protein YckC
MIAVRSSRKEHTVSTPNNYAPPQSVVADIASTDTPFEKATRLSRLGAVLLDFVIFSVPLIPLYWIIFSTMFHAGANARNFPALWVSAMVGAGVFLYVGGLVYLALLVVTIVLVNRNAQTIGKKLMGIKVARTDGSRASLARIFWLRNVVNQLVTMVLLLVPFVGGFYPLVDTCMIFGEKRRCCHDYIADTIVIRA